MDKNGVYIRMHDYRFLIFLLRLTMIISSNDNMKGAS